MAWNGSDQSSRGKSPATTSSARGGSVRPTPTTSIKRGALAGLIVVALGGAALWWFFVRSGGAISSHDNRAVTCQAKVVDALSPIATNSVSLSKAEEASNDEKMRAAQIAREYNEQVKGLIKAKTNNIVWLQKPLDPDDPDHALRTRVAQELGTLLSVEPGEQMPPFPFAFLSEDALKAAAERGEDVGTIDNGNAAFMESLKKFKIAAKETDDEHRLEYKTKLIEAQGELLTGLDKGLSVNDSIRSAYEFRKRAYESRSAAIETMSEFVQKGDAAEIEDTKGVLKQVNEKFAEQGIKAITEEEIGIESSEETEEGESAP